MQDSLDTATAVRTSVRLRTERTVTFQGSTLARKLLHAIGWRLIFDGLPARQGVIIVYPHTSNWDFVVGILAKWSIGFLPKFWAKDSLFRLPIIGPWMRWLGGIPLDRSHPRGVVGATLSTFAQSKARDEFCWLVVTPEGTRSLTPGFRTGFYQVARLADVPLGVFAFDYATRTIHASHFIDLSGNETQDYEAIRAVFAKARGYNPQLASPIQPRPTQSPTTTNDPS